jgi:YaiO family outer membrane protein
MRAGRRIACWAGAALVLAVSAGAQAQTADELYRQAVAARQEQRFDEAAELLKRALVLEPSNSDALVQLGFAELGRGDLSAARAAFSRTLELAPNYSDAKFGLAQVEFRSGNLQAALSLVERLVQEQPGNAETSALLASVREALAAERRAAASSARDVPGSSPKPQADPLTPLLEEGRRLRNAGRFPEAEAVYRRALSISPRNTDILVALGLVSGFQQRFEESRAFFDAALAIDRKHLDARLGKVRLAVWTGAVAQARTLIDDVTASVPRNSEAQLLDARIALLERDNKRAEALFSAVAAAEPTNIEALIGLGDVRRARGQEALARQAYEQAADLDPASLEIKQRLAAPPPRKWRLDVGSEVSELSAGLGTWTDSGVGLSYQLSPETSAGLRMRVATRFGKTDLQVEGRLDHAFSPAFAAYGIVAATPDADFLAKFSVGAGAGWRAIERSGGFGPVFLNTDARYDVFDASRITTLSPWLQVYLLEERLAFSARWVHAEDDAETAADGYVLRADVAATERIGIFVGYSDAPEISEGLLIDTRTAFGGVSFDVNDTLTVRASYAHEQRPTFDRDTIGLSFSVRF